MLPTVSMRQQFSLWRNEERPVCACVCVVKTLTQQPSFFVRSYHRVSCCKNTCTVLLTFNILFISAQFQNENTRSFFLFLYCILYTFKMVQICTRVSPQQLLLFSLHLVFFCFLLLTLVFLSINDTSDCHLSYQFFLAVIKSGFENYFSKRLFFIIDSVIKKWGFHSTVC